MTGPYYQDEFVTLYCGDMRQVLPELGEFDACVTDPPYGETAHAWDRWVAGGPSLVARHTRSLWSFGSARMFLEHGSEFAGWKFAQDKVWEKHNGTGSATDRFRRVHESQYHWYRGDWSTIYHAVPREAPVFTRGGDTSVSQRAAGEHHGKIGVHRYQDDGTRLARSVVRHPSVRGGLHKTEKPGKVLVPLIEYSVPLGGVVLDPFAGSGSTGWTARQVGRRAVLVEADEAACEKAAERLAVLDLFALSAVEGGVVE